MCHRLVYKVYLHVLGEILIEVLFSVLTGRISREGPAPQTEPHGTEGTEDA